MKKKPDPAARWLALVQAANTTSSSQANARPGKCRKCKGTGTFRWKEGNLELEGICFSCKGNGEQDRTQIERNITYGKAHFLQKVHMLEIIMDHVKPTQLDTILKALMENVPGFRDSVLDYLEEGK